MTEDETHVVLIGRAGGHPGTDLYLVGPGSKKNAIHTAEEKFRKERKLAKNIALVSKVAFSGSPEEGEKFIERLVAMMDPDKVQEVSHGN